MPHSTAAESFDSICQEATIGTIAIIFLCDLTDKEAQMSEKQGFERAVTTDATLAPTVPYSSIDRTFSRLSLSITYLRTVQSGLLWFKTRHLLHAHAYARIRQRRTETKFD